jgi:excisionase family DNA binding protein
MLKTPEAAQRIGISKSRLRMLAKLGEVPATKVGKGTKHVHFEFKVKDLLDWKHGKVAESNGREPVKVFKVSDPPYEEPDARLERLVARKREALTAALNYPAKPVSSLVSGPGPIGQRLDRIEQLLEQLLRLWS